MNHETREITEISATVTALEGSYAYVRIDGGGCGRCHEQGGCGGANISQMLCGKERVWRVLNSRGVKVGEQVRVAVTAGALWAGVVLLYAVPLAAFIVGAMLGAALHGESGAIAASILALCFAWLWVARRLRARKLDLRFQPYIL